MFKTLLTLSFASLLFCSNAFALLGGSQPQTHFPGGFPNGVTIRGIPVLSSPPGEVWYVGSSTTRNDSDGNSGKTPESCFSSAQHALNVAGTSTAPLIIFLPGHTETITDPGLDINKAGVTLLGLGVGTELPTFTLGSTTSSNGIDVDAANVTFKNLSFTKASTGSLTTMVDIDAAWCTIEDCIFTQAITNKVVADTAISIGTGSDFCMIKNNDFVAGTVSANQAIYLEHTSGVNDIYITGNKIDGHYDNGGIADNAGVNISVLRVVIKDNLIKQDEIGDHCIELQGTQTGFISDNRLFCNSTATTIDPGACAYIQNFVGSASAKGVAVP